MFKRAKLWVRLLVQTRETHTLLHDQSAEASFDRTASNASDAAAHSTAETINTNRPGYSMVKLKISGEPACAMRAGAPINPRR